MELLHQNNTFQNECVKCIYINVFVRHAESPSGVAKSPRKGKKLQTYNYTEPIQCVI